MDALPAVGTTCVIDAVVFWHRWCGQCCFSIEHSQLLILDWHSELARGFKLARDRFYCFQS